jgi:hypothetical protein
VSPFFSNIYCSEQLYQILYPIPFSEEENEFCEKNAMTVGISVVELMKHWLVFASPPMKLELRKKVNNLFVGLNKAIKDAVDAYQNPKKLSGDKGWEQDRIIVVDPNRK